MRLKHIKLSGFKSFVDATKVAVPNNLIGIVGPNGCGKSNVIDAVRWVMGESSAKTLRGSSMEDVIFNGSSVRKPVNRAYVELVFDNSEGKAPGSYAKFAEIGIRRELIREGGSKYFINKNRCRRKDIQDIFLGTGLGPRSYSIIEQGMVGKIVESKPEDLRVLIEEAAGISRYKERRRETENRIRHTRDNLSRVEDIIGELETQLRRLKRQANEAERYKTFKQDQRDLDGQLKTLRWADLHAQLKTKDVELERLQTEFESQVSEQRDVESQIEAMRQEQHVLSETLNTVQAEYYGIGGEIAALEQSIEHARITREQQREEFERLVESQREASQHLEMDQIRLTEAQAAQVELNPLVDSLVSVYENANTSFQQADMEFQQWQQQWEQLNRDAADPEKEREVQSERKEQHERQIHHFDQRLQQVGSTLKDIDEKINIQEIQKLKATVEQIDASCAELEASLVQHDANLAAARAEQEECRERHSLVRHKLQDDSAQLNSLKALQAAALGEDNSAVNEWLQRRGIKDNARLASKLSVKRGWELAVDTVLSGQLNAVSVNQLETYAKELSDFDNGRIWLVDQSSAPLPQTKQNLEGLNEKVSADSINIDGWFYGIYAVDTVVEALQHRHRLTANESIVTREGAWIGTNWASFGSDQIEGGVLQREAQIENLSDKVDLAGHDLQKIQAQGEILGSTIQKSDEQREQARSEFRNKSHKRTELHNQLSGVEARSAELLAQRDQLLIEQQELNDQLAAAREEVDTAQKRMEDARELANNFEQRRAQLSEQKDSLVVALDQAREKEQQARDDRQAKQIELERSQSSSAALVESIARLTQQLEGQAVRRSELAAIIEVDDDPSAGLREQLQDLLENRLTVEKSLSGARNALAEFENRMQDADQQRLGFDRKSQTVRDSLESVKMNRQEILVRRNTIAEELEQDEEQMLKSQQNLPQDISSDEIEQTLTGLARKLERIGAVNLVAIDEFEECAERKIYLDKQHADLTEAMTTLESAINKIDKETRTRFKETFDSLNEGFKEYFPKLFGGGSAYLELTGNDLLDTGVGVMARPPGKRNSTIALLSGGEKALAAVSLLFAFFELNPAPFCVLDEVDAPMDDANVERYAGVLKQLGEKTQLLFITHNKITMEVADILVGVTMAEAGVSRLVAVDVAEATAMAVQ